MGFIGFWVWGLGSLGSLRSLGCREFRFLGWGVGIRVQGLGSEVQDLVCKEDVVLPFMPGLDRAPRIPL